MNGMLVVAVMLGTLGAELAQFAGPFLICLIFIVCIHGGIPKITTCPGLARIVQFHPAAWTCEPTLEDLVTRVHAQV